MSNVQKYIILIEEKLTKLLLIAVVGLVFFAAVFRWGGFPVAWSVEMAQLLFIWIIFLGANQALRNNRHIGVNILTEKLPQKVKVAVAALMDLLVAAFLIFMIYYGFQHSLHHSLRSIQNLPLSYSYITSAIPVGCSLMLLTLIFKWSRALSAQRNRKVGRDDE
ncbi:TRAP transporter small permease [Alkalihalobacillus oceani]|uniref:TRAP transporter small permease n=1 Tax=Halalkalibacter oceani TaxID=1653776 RepID=UPI00203FE787|nr:TRAP transporter small permease [Halalkalibacter oceani]MCM3759958.1 TRAP transporter small permease [Halalkalibacter oceani]